MGKKKKGKRTAAIPGPPGSTGYGDAGASLTKNALKGFKARSTNPNTDINDNNDTLRQRARMLYMASPIAASAIKTFRTNVIGSGLQLKSRINQEILGMSPEDAETWQKKVELEFSLWASCKRACDAQGINNFYGMQQLAFASWILSGDAFALIRYEDPTFMHPYSLRLQLIEADRIATPEIYGGQVAHDYTTGKNTTNDNWIYDGVEVDSAGKIVAYHIRSDYPYDAIMEPTEWYRIPAYGEQTDSPNILHLMKAERPDQYRGVTILAQDIEPLLQTRRYVESELNAAVVESYFTAFVTTQDPTTSPFNPLEGDYHLDESEANETDVEMGPAEITYLAPGENVTFANPSRPANGFTPFVDAQHKQTGAALELPSGLLTKSFNSSYSASRAEILEADKTFRMWRKDFISDFTDPIYELFLSEAVARGRIDAPGFFEDPAVHAAWLGCEWIGPSQGHLDPTKEMQAIQMALEMGLTTRAQEAIKYNGSDYDANVQKLAIENEQLANANESLSQLKAVEKKGQEGLEAELADADKKGSEADAIDSEGASNPGQNPSDQSAGAI